MSRVERLAGAITGHSRWVVVVLLLVSTVVGAGMPAVEQSSSMDQFQGDSTEAEKLDYVESNFTAGEANTTATQVIVRGDDVLDRRSLIDQLEFQAALREDEAMNATLADETPTIGVANVVGAAAIQHSEVQDLRERGEELEARGEELNESRDELEARGDELNETARQLQGALDTLRENPNASVRAEFERVDENSSVDLTEDDYGTFERAAAGVRSNTSEIGPTIESGTERVLEDEYAAVRERERALNRTGTQLKEALDYLRQNRLASIREEFDEVNENTSVELTEQDYQEFEAAAEKLRRAVTQEQAEEAYREGTEGVLEDKAVALGDRADALNETGRQLGESLSTVAQDEDADAREEFERVDANTSVDLDADDWRDYEATVEEIESLQANVEASYRLGTEGVLSDRYDALEERGEELEAEAAELEADAEELEAQREELTDPSADEMPPLAEQREQLESMNDSEVATVVELVLGEETNASIGGPGGGEGAFAFMPTSYEPGATSAEATMLVVSQEADGQVAQGTASDRLVSSQLAIQERAEERFGDDDVMVFGAGVISDEIERSMTDSLALVGPLAILFVLVVLVVAYRDLVDILLGLSGIALVLVWTFGFMGWTGIEFNQIFISVPVLLIGLSIDYAIHVFMRHREERDRQEGSDDAAPVRGSMRVALASVGVALTWVTATTVIGFLSNLSSSLPPIREFGVVSAFGIVAAFVVFGALIPAIKVEIDEFLEARGIDRRKRAFGTGGGRFGEFLDLGTTAARTAPVAVVAVALLVSAGGAYGATQVDTSFSQSDFLAEEPPEWTATLPAAVQPGEYSAKSSLEYVNDEFVREDTRARILVEGEVTRPDALERVARGQREAADSDVTVVLSNGEADVESPLTVMRSVAAENETFNETFAAADTDGDDVPDRNLTAVYDGLYSAAPDRAESVVHRGDDGEYQALLMTVSLRGGAGSDAVASEMRGVADEIEGGGLAATATGQPIVFKIVQDQLLDTVVQGLLITLVAVFAFLMLTYRITDGSATLGFVTLLPVVLSVTWILGTMYLAGIPFNVMTGMITSLTVGMGVAYSIHVSERYAHELERQGSVWEAMRTTVVGTGGALLGSAATTVGGFGVLAFAILPPLQQFGLITGLTIIYAFLGSVFVLPSMLVLWTRYAGPSGVFPETGPDAGPSSPPAAPGDPSDSPATESPSFERSVEPAVVRPGGRVTGTATLAGVSGRAVLREQLPVDDVAVESVDPDPVHAVADDGIVYVAWEFDGPTQATVEYAGSVPASADDGAELPVEGVVRTADGDRLERTTTLEVVDDLLGRIDDRGWISAADLRAASEAFRTGELSRSRFQRIHREWLRQVAADAGADAGPDADAGDRRRPELPGEDDD